MNKLTEEQKEEITKALTRTIESILYYKGRLERSYYDIIFPFICLEARMFLNSDQAKLINKFLLANRPSKELYKELYNHKTFNKKENTDVSDPWWQRNILDNTPIKDRLSITKEVLEEKIKYLKLLLEDLQNDNYKY